MSKKDLVGWIMYLMKNDFSCKQMASMLEEVKISVDLLFCD